MRKVGVWALRPGMEVARKVYDAHGHLLLNTGVRLENEYIRSLRKLEIPAVYVVNTLIPDVRVEDVIRSETRHRAMQLAQNIINDLFNAPQKNRFSLPRLFAFRKELNGVVDDMIAQLLACKELVINLSDIRTTDNYTFAHSVNVAVLSLMSASAMGFSRNELQVIGVGSFLHDIGKSMIAPVLLNKPGQLLPGEWHEMRQHPAYGYDLIKQQPFVDSQAARIIYQHHERVDGKGYPEGLTGPQIHPYSKICAIVDSYDALVSDRPYRQAFPPHRALEMLLSEQGGFDLEISQVFFRHVAAYPVGTLVGINNGLIGITVQNFAGYPTRPKVRIICEKDNLLPLPVYELDLSADSNLDLKIDRVYEDQELSLCFEPSFIKRLRGN